MVSGEMDRVSIQLIPGRVVVGSLLGFGLRVCSTVHHCLSPFATATFTLIRAPTDPNYTSGHIIAQTLSGHLQTHYLLWMLPQPPTAGLPTSPPMS